MNHRFAVAPMMGYTDRHYRYFVRLMSQKAYLYTEMISANSLIHGETDYLLKYNPIEHPLACQLGGSDPKKLYDATQIVSSYNYDSINFNLGCPSSKVQDSTFGACLMFNPGLVEICLKSMIDAAPSNIPITVKMRIGVEILHEKFLYDFVERLKNIGIQQIIVHARIALLKKTPKENRNIPPLQYEIVYRLKEKYPDINIYLNGGIENLEQAQKHLLYVDGCMMGRAAYHNSYILSDVDHVLFSEKNKKKYTRNELIQLMQEYIKTQSDVKSHNVQKHLLGLFHNTYKGKQMRRLLTEKILINYDKHSI